MKPSQSKVTDMQEHTRVSHKGIAECMYLYHQLIMIACLPYFVQPLDSLVSEDEEGQVEEILERLKREVKQRRLLLYPYLRDYDRVRTRVCGW